MKISLHCCEQMRFAIESGQIPLSYSAKFREYGIEILDGGTSALTINYCPWCGAKLPESLRDEWFDKLEKLGIDPFGSAIPEIFQNDGWYSQKNIE